MEINQEILLETELPLQSVQNFSMHWELNEHARMSLAGILESGSEDHAEKQDYVGTEITVRLADTIEQTGDGVLFRGLVQKTELYKDHGVGMACVEAVSASAKLDTDQLCRSFQDPSLSYPQVAKQIAETGNGLVICTTEKERIGEPVICYQETIWEFLKRLASHQGSFLIPDIKTGRPNLWLGMRSGEQIKEDMEDGLTRVEIRKQYGGKKKERAVITYCMECRASYSLGDWVLKQGEKLVICEKKAWLDKGDISFFYRFSDVKGLREEPFYNGRFTGMSLWGTVAEARDETMRVTFDMDGEEGKWFYPWRPETGNALYAMPETGAKVAVYFMNHDEGTGIAVRCAGEPPSNQGTEDKSMKIPANGQAQLFKSSLNIGIGSGKMELKDSGKVNISGGQIEIEAVGKVKIQGKRITMDVASEIRATTE